MKYSPYKIVSISRIIILTSSNFVYAFLLIEWSFKNKNNGQMFSYKLLSDYENDEEDIFRCGVCSKEFCVLEAFQRHKLSFCRQKNTISGKYRS